MQGLKATTYAFSHKNKKHQKIKGYRNMFRKNLQLKRCLFILDLKPLRS